jgi:hypothetical protein
MKRLVILLLLLVSCTTPPPEVERPSLLIIEEASPDKRSALARQNLLHLTQVYDLAPFITMPKILILKTPDPKLKSTATISAQHADDPYRLLSDLLHEQFHWLRMKQMKNFVIAVSALRAKFRELPQPAPGSRTTSPHLELLVTFLEQTSLYKLLGEAGALKISQQIKAEGGASAQFYELAETNADWLRRICQQTGVATFLF